MRYVVLLVVLVLFVQTAWAAYQSARRRLPQDLPNAIGSACILLALFTPLKWLGVVGIGLLLWSRYLAQKTRTERGPEIRHVPHRDSAPAPKWLSPPSIDETTQRLRIPVSALAVPAARGGLLMVSGPTLGVALSVKHEDRPEGALIEVESRVTDDDGKIWRSESAIRAQELDRIADEAGGAARVAYAEAPPSWQAAFGTAALVNGLSWLGSRQEPVVLDLALLNQETLVVAVTDARGRVAYTLPVTELLWYVSPRNHLVRLGDGWVAPTDAASLAFHETLERDTPSPNVTHRS